MDGLMERLTVLVMEQHAAEKTRITDLGKLQDGREWSEIVIPYTHPEMVRGVLLAIKFDEVRELSGVIPTAMVIHVDDFYEETTLYMWREYIDQLERVF
jgi:hypothetical protein